MITREDFACPCCGENEIRQEIVDLVETLESHIVDLTITSGYRCKKHNAEVGGSPTSSHLKGLAVDLAAPNSRTRYSILEWCFELCLGRIGIGKTFIHIDKDPDKPGDVLWLY